MIVFQAPARQQNPKNAENKAKAEMLSVDIARLQTELAGWTAAKAKYGPDAPDPSPAGAGDVCTNDELARACNR
jgi:hypothetical protein